MKNKFVLLLSLLAPSVLFSMSKEEALCNAIDCDDEAKVQKLLEEGANPLIPNERGSTLLMSALGNGSSARIEDLLMQRDLQKQVLLRDAFGYTVLHKAASRLNARVIPLFVAAGAQIDDNKNEFELTPLMQAVCQFTFSPDYIKWQLETVRALLDHGADPRIADRQKETPLMVAQKCKPHLVQMLKEKLATYAKSDVK